MGLLRKKDKSSKSTKGSRNVDSGVSKDNNFVGSQRKSTTGPTLEATKIEDVDSGGLSTPKYSDPYSPTANTENSSMSGDSNQETIDTPSGYASKSSKGGPWFTSRQIRLFKKPPPAELAAYKGPPRYDWVDIETSAAIKIQAAYRRKHVMSMLEEEGRGTAAARNQARRRRAAKEATTNPAQDFINIFNCCGVDLGLGGGNQETYFDITRELESARYFETNKEKAEREERIRNAYKRKPPKDSLVENVEVVQ